jgi:uncharacterized protein DUF4267
MLSSALSMVPRARQRHVGAVKTFSRLELGLALVLGLFLLFLALRGFVAPAEAARGFGIPIVDLADLFYLRVKADRDLFSAAAVFVLLARRERRALGAFMGVATLQPLCDLVLSLTDARGQAGYALAVHGSTVLYCVGLAALLLRKRGTP